MNRIIGLVPKLVRESADGQVTIQESPSSVWWTYLSFLVWDGIAFIVIAHRVWYVLVDLPILAYMVTRAFTAATVHLCFIRRVSEMHELLKDLERLHVQTPIYWVLVPYVLTGASAVLSGLRHVFVREPLYVTIFRYMYDVIPSFIIANACCQIAFQVDGLKYALKDLNQRISQLSKDSKDIDIRRVLSRHVEIRATCSLLNQSYGEPMFLLIFYMFLDFTFAVYFSSTLRESGVENAFHVFKSLSQTLPSVALMYVCQHAEKAFDETRMLTGKINELNGIFPCHIYGEISEWNIQIRQLPILFTANGYFRVNKKTFRAVISTIITYAVILLQTVKAQ